MLNWIVWNRTAFWHRNCVLMLNCIVWNRTVFWHRNCVLILNWIVWNRTAFWHRNCVLMLNCIVWNRTVFWHRNCVLMLNWIVWNRTVFDIETVLMLNSIIWNRTVYMYENGFGIHNLQCLMCHKTKPNQLFICRRRRISWMHTIPKRYLLLCDILTVLSRFWTRVVVSISLDNDHYTRGAYCAFKHECIEI